MSLLASRLETAMSAKIKIEIENAFGFVSIPGYDPVEFKKFTDALSKALSITIIDEFVNNAALSGATLDDGEVSGTVDTTTSNAAQPVDSGVVDDLNVSGGII